MWVRAVAVAVVAVACCAVTAQAAQYAEVWNPPEARHAPKRVKGHAPASTKVAAKAVVTSKSKRLKVEPKTKASLHAAHQVKPHGKLVAKSAAGKPVKTVRSKGVPSKAVKMASANTAPNSATGTRNLPPILH
jgi:hypothetical protein